MAKKTLLVSPVVTTKPNPYKILGCPLFQHMKHTDVCTVTRAKGVCRMQCQQYFVFANENPEAVKSALERYAPAIADHRRRYELPEVDLIKYVMPAGENICSYCGKSFVTDTRLHKHVELKHKRMKHELDRSAQERKDRREQKEILSSRVRAARSAVLCKGRQPRRSQKSV